jgi:hypothetical protein
MDSPVLFLCKLSSQLSSFAPTHSTLLVAPPRGLPLGGFSLIPFILTNEYELSFLIYPAARSTLTGTVRGADAGCLSASSLGVEARKDDICRRN